MCQPDEARDRKIWILLRNTTERGEVLKVVALGLGWGRT